MRQVDRAAADRGACRADRGPGPSLVSGLVSGLARCRQRAGGPCDRVRVSGADADALDQRARECAAAADACPCSAPGSGGARVGGAGARRPLRFRGRLSARIVRRHEDAGVAGARAGHRSGHPADGRAVRSTRRDHPLSPQRRSADAVAQPRQDRHLRHAFGVRIRLSVAARGGDDPAAGADRRGDPYRGRRTAVGRVQDLGRLCRLLSQGLGRAGAVLCRADGAMSATPEKSEGEGSILRGLRILLPAIVAVAGTAAWELLVRIYDIQPYVLPGPVSVFQTLIGDWGVLSQSLLATLTTTVEGFIAAAIGGIALALLFNLSRLLEYSLFPYAVILQVTPVIAIAPLLLIYLPQQTAVIVCAWIVAFFPVLSNTTLGLNSVDRNLAGLFQLYGASRVQTLRYLKLPAALPYILGGLRIAGGLSLIGAVVAEIAVGSAGAGSGLAYRIAESGYRLNIPRMFAALLLLSAAGIVIYGLLALTSHLALRRWHESALGRED